MGDTMSTITDEPTIATVDISRYLANDVEGKAEVVAEIDEACRTPRLPDHHRPRYRP